MTTITLQLKDQVVARLDADSMNQGLSLEAFIESWLNDWYDFTAPATPQEAAQVPSPTESALTFERLRPIADENLR